jgi:SAM-dependent methyltransferase
MCDQNCINFGKENLFIDEIKGKRVIEVGSCDVNGSLKALVTLFEPIEYIGVDIEKGFNVDIVCNAQNLAKKFGKESFDVVISTEMIEHIADWKKVISNFKKICKPQGIILITTRSYGFGYHAYPCDFWRYEVEDMKNIFSDCEILKIYNDAKNKGVFLKSKSPKILLKMICQIMNCTA